MQVLGDTCRQCLSFTCVPTVDPRPPAVMLLWMQRCSEQLEPPGLLNCGICERPGSTSSQNEHNTAQNNIVFIKHADSWSSCGHKWDVKAKLSLSPPVIKGKLSFFFCSVLCNPKSTCLMAAMTSQRLPCFSLGAAASRSVVSPRQVGTRREQERRVGAAGLSCIPSFEGPTSSHASGTGSTHRCWLCWFILAFHIAHASRVWGRSALLPRRAPVPSSSMAPTKALCAVKDRPASLPFSFLRSISLTCHSGDRTDRTEVPHRQNGLCWSKDRSKGWVRWKKQQSRVESQRERLDSRA